MFYFRCLNSVLFVNWRVISILFSLIGECKVDFLDLEKVFGCCFLFSCHILFKLIQLLGETLNSVFEQINCI